VEVNLALAPLFIFAFHWGIRGAATATVCAQCVGSVWAFLHFTRKEHAVRFCRGCFKPKLRIIRDVVSIGLPDLLILSVSIVSAIALFLFLKFSKIGQALRATAQDFEAAQQMGVRVDRVNASAFAIASALGALAGALIGLYYNFISPSSGFQAGLKGFTACVLGGLGSVPAAMAGGLVLGLVESFGGTLELAPGVAGEGAKFVIALPVPDEAAG